MYQIILMRLVRKPVINGAVPQLTSLKLSGTMYTGGNLTTQYIHIKNIYDTSGNTIMSELPANKLTARQVISSVSCDTSGNT
jgi:hypothetical protein